MQRLFSNFLSLSILQWVNYVLPLVTFPYLIRVLGVEMFGLLALATALISYFNVVVDYGFNLTAVHDIATYSNSRKKVEEIFCTVITIKLILIAVSFLTLLLIVFTFEVFSNNWEVYLLTFGIVVGQAISPIWFFQGMEKMKYIAYINVFTKVIFTVCIFLFVKHEGDYHLVPTFVSFGYIVAGLLSMVVVRIKFNIKFHLLKNSNIKATFAKNWNIFISNIFVSLYTATNILLLGIMTNNTVTGYYSIAEKIVHAFGGFFTPLTQAIYPLLSEKYLKSKSLFLGNVTSLIIKYIAFSVITVVAMYVYSDFIVTILSGKIDTNVLEIYYILTLSVIVIPLGPLYTQALNILKLTRILKHVSRNTFIFTVILSPIAIYFYSATGLAIIVVLSQILIVSLCARILHMEKNTNNDF